MIYLDNPTLRVAAPPTSPVMPMMQRSVSVPVPMPVPGSASGWQASVNPSYTQPPGKPWGNVNVALPGQSYQPHAPVAPYTHPRYEAASMLPPQAAIQPSPTQTFHPGPQYQPADQFNRDPVSSVSTIPTQGPLYDQVTEDRPVDRFQPQAETIQNSSQEAQVAEELKQALIPVLEKYPELQPVVSEIANDLPKSVDTIVQFLDKNPEYYELANHLRGVMKEPEKVLEAVHNTMDNPVARFLIKRLKGPLIKALPDTLEADADRLVNEFILKQAGSADV